MAVKLTLRALIAAHSAIQTLPAKMPIKASYRFGRIGRHMRDAVLEYNEQRAKLMAELGRPIKDGAAYDLGENKAKFDEQINSLLDEEIEVPFDTLTFAEIEGGDPAKAPEIDPAAFEALADFIKE